MSYSLVISVEYIFLFFLLPAEPTFHLLPTWNMLSSPPLPPLAELLGLEVSPLFGFLAGFSGGAAFFRFA